MSSLRSLCRAPLSRSAAAFGEQPRTTAISRLSSCSHAAKRRTSRSSGDNHPECREHVVRAAARSVSGGAGGVSAASEKPVASPPTGSPLVGEHSPCHSVQPWQRPGGTSSRSCRFVWAWTAPGRRRFALVDTTSIVWSPTRTSFAPFGRARSAYARPVPGRPPNIVLVMSDQHRADALGCAGNEVVQTPHLDRLASDGFRFERMYCQGPLCKPSRASLLTGRHVGEHGMLWNGGAMPATWATMARALKDRGYDTAVVGKTHFGGGERNARALGFDHVVEEFDKYSHARENACTPYTRYLEERGLLAEYRAQVRRLDWLGPRAWDGETSVVPAEHDLTTFILDRAVSWLEGRSSGRPFFLSLSFVGPHPPFTDDPEWAAVYADAPVPPPIGPRIEPQDNSWGHYLRELGRFGALMSLPEPRVANTTRHYYGQVSRIDDAVGRLCAVLDELGHGPDTWVVYTSDHGEMLGDHGLWNKAVFYLPSVLVPGIVRPPDGGVGVVVPDPVESIDLTATIIELAGAVLPVCGRSLLPRLRGDTMEPRPATSELAALGHHLLMVATDRHRYTYDRATGEACELFDLADDPT